MPVGWLECFDKQVLTVAASNVRCVGVTSVCSPMGASVIQGPLIAAELNFLFVPLTAKLLVTTLVDLDACILCWVATQLHLEEHESCLIIDAGSHPVTIYILVLHECLKASNNLGCAAFDIHIGSVLGPCIADCHGIGAAILAPEPVTTAGLLERPATIIAVVKQDLVLDDIANVRFDDQIVEQESTTHLGSAVECVDFQVIVTADT